MPHHGHPIAGHKREGGEEHQVVWTLLREDSYGAADGKREKVKRPDTQDAAYIEAPQSYCPKPFLFSQE